MILVTVGVQLVPIAVSKEAPLLNTTQFRTERYVPRSI